MVALSKLRGLYQAVITEHANAPHHSGKIKADLMIQLDNPTCGDKIDLFVKIDETDQIADLSYENIGCSISTASASMMSDLVIGKSLVEVKELAEQFSNLMQGHQVANQDDLGEAVTLAGVAQFPQRIKCATLAWNALKKIIEIHDHPQDA